VRKKFQMELPLFFPRKVRLTETQFLIWFSAWLDTEGSIVLYGDKKYDARYAQITVYQKDITPLKIMESKLGGYVLNQQFKDSLVYRWVLTGHKAVAVLIKIANYLVVKKAKAINVIQYYELKNSVYPKRSHAGQATSLALLSHEINEKYRELVNDQSVNWKRCLTVALEPHAPVN
jgi:hypothetical protein